MKTKARQVKIKNLSVFIFSNAGLGTEAEKVEKLSPLFFSTPRNLLIWDQVEMLCSCY